MVGVGSGVGVCKVVWSRETPSVMQGWWSVVCVCVVVSGWGFVRVYML